MMPGDSYTTNTGSTSALIIQGFPSTEVHYDASNLVQLPSAESISHPYMAMFPNQQLHYAVPPVPPQNMTTTSVSIPIQNHDGIPRSSDHASHSPTTPHRISRRTSRQTLNHRRSKASLSTSAGRVAPAGFVNFTPEDSRKILTGVAPSGSSKTKARREKEALDKRRRLSQAAARAVLEAGGDMSAFERLEREGLFA